MTLNGLGGLIASSVIIVALTILGFIVVQILSRRILQGVQAMKHVREARRQQLATLIPPPQPAKQCQ